MIISDSISIFCVNEDGINIPVFIQKYDSVNQSLIVIINNTQ